MIFLEINKDFAEGIKIETDEYEIIFAKKKKDAKIKIEKEIWFKRIYSENNKKSAQDLIDDES